MPEPLINSDEVMQVFDACHVQPEKELPDMVKVEGIISVFYFKKSELSRHKEQVKTWLAALPEYFQAEQGGGWSFLYACQDRNGVQWTGFHHVMDKLFSLGIALELVQYCLPREYWEHMPGGVPYMVIHLKGDPLG